MATKQSLLFITFVSLVLLIVVSPMMNCRQLTPDTNHSFVTSEDFQKLPRNQQIQKCSNCHKQQFDNEMRGPHAYAFQSISEHKDFVNSTKYDCDFYTKHVNRSYDYCLGCHTPQNLYQTSLNEKQFGATSMVDSLLRIDHPHPPTREIGAGQRTGIDCMSCHFDGEKLITLKHIPTKDDSVVEKQTLQQITKNNLTCYLCHFDAVRNFNPEIAIQKTGTALCVNCHIESNKQGNRTHYFYWQHDTAEKHNPKPTLLLSDFHFTVSPDKKEGIITWQNTVMPHKISPGPEMVLFWDILSKDSIVLGSKTIRINKKKEFDKEMYNSLGRNQLGVMGEDVPLDGKPIMYHFPLVQANKAAIIRVRFMHKSQYWFPDSLGKVELVKTYPIIQ